MIATPEMVEALHPQGRARIATDRASVERMVLDEVVPNPSGVVPFPDDVGRFIAMVVGGVVAPQRRPPQLRSAAPPSARHLIHPRW